MLVPEALVETQLKILLNEAEKWYVTSQFLCLTCINQITGYPKISYALPILRFPGWKHHCMKGQASNPSCWIPILIPTLIPSAVIAHHVDWLSTKCTPVIALDSN